MRPPQCSRRPIPVWPSCITIFLIFTALLPLGAHGATQQLVSSPASLRFGSVLLGQTESQLITLTNNGPLSATVSSIAVINSEFTVSGLTLPATLAVGQSVNLSVIFAPTAAGWTGGNIGIISDATNPILKLAVGGSGANSLSLGATPSSLSFGSVPVGTSSSLSVVLTDLGSWLDTLTAFQTVGSSFSVSGLTLPVILTSGQSATLKITFTPQTAGLTSGSVFVAGLGLNIPFTGTGTIAQLSLNPTSLNFGSVDIGSTSTLPFSATAVGGSVTISSATSNSSQFALSGGSFPVTLSAGQSTGFNVNFSPTASGTQTATLTIFSNASNSSTTESLTGVGNPPLVALSWTASTSSVVGYNVYRGTVVSSLSKINTALDPNTAYTDTTVVPGATYFYAATAVNSSGEESVYSTPVEVLIP